ncbi:MAG TPA: ABC transporter substrate-binding protein [Candidatus Binatia bacterium]|nr:ABC transporter substrate-binding protein [Candidatus Binatia bacterium]
MTPKLTEIATALLLIALFASTTSAATKVSFPFTPISAASLPWWIAKESRFYEKYGLDVDMIYVGASPVIIQAMLGGQAGVGAGGGPPLVTNILQGGDVVEVATTIPYAIQSLIVKPEIRTPADLTGKKIGISRLGAIPHYTLQAIVKLHNVQGINIVQTGTTTQAITSLSQGLVDGIITSAPFTFRLMKDGYRELVGPKEFKKAGVQFLIQGLVARKSFAAKNRDVVIGMIKATMEGTRQIFVNEKHAKAVLAKYTRQNDPEILDRTHKFALDIFVKDPTVTPASIQPIVQQSAEFNVVDAKLASNTPIGAYYDNSYIEEIKKSGFFTQLWK